MTKYAKKRKTHQRDDIPGTLGGYLLQPVVEGIDQVLVPPVELVQLPGDQIGPARPTTGTGGPEAGVRVQRRLRLQQGLAVLLQPLAPDLGLGLEVTGQLLVASVLPVSVGTLQYVKPCLSV